MKFLKLIRYQNLILLALMQFSFRYGFLIHQDVPLALADWQFSLLVLATVLLAAAGYIINDIFDQDTDEINKPQKQIIGTFISENKAYNLYVALNLTGVAFGFYLSNVILRPSFAVIFIFIAASLYFYATQLKRIALVGNLLVAILTGVSVLLLGVFDLYPATYDANRDQMAIMFKILMDYAFFAFFINFIRELVKDAEDYKGDFAVGAKTLPVLIGTKITAKIVFVLHLIALLLLINYTTTHLFENNLLIATLYVLITVVAPLVLTMIKSWKASSTEDFQTISKVLKVVIFFGIMSIVVITYSIKWNA